MLSTPAYVGHKLRKSSLTTANPTLSKLRDANLQPQRRELQSDLVAYVVNSCDEVLKGGQDKNEISEDFHTAETLVRSVLTAGFTYLQSQKNTLQSLYHRPTILKSRYILKMMKKDFVAEIHPDGWIDLLAGVRTDSRESFDRGSLPKTQALDCAPESVALPWLQINVSVF